jgi:hypothetical protein
MYSNRVKTLGYYLLAVCVLQIAVYLVLSFSAEADWLIYFDPRLGLFYFESGLRGKEIVAPTFLRWVSVFWIFGLAVLMLSGVRLVKTYIVSELVLCLANVLFVAAIVWANLSPAHGFSIAELSVPLMVMLVCDAVPLGLAVWAQRSKSERTRFPSGARRTSA